MARSKEALENIRNIKKVYFIAWIYHVKLLADNHCPQGCGRKAEP
jgi:hypothetical protein